MIWVKTLWINVCNILERIYFKLWGFVIKPSQDCLFCLIQWLLVESGLFRRCVFTCARLMIVDCSVFESGGGVFMCVCPYVWKVCVRDSDPLLGFLMSHMDHGSWSWGGRGGWRKRQEDLEDSEGGKGAFWGKIGRLKGRKNDWR